ncbi:PLAT/LH2 domain-containing protein [Streptomyces sp. NPDC012769]|uniref:PLAT/LH2 domain-containing protein n=1 Tax=Streptomyces sp. NPDC012769 TaxID=3364848 RepID=UPI00368E511F
MVEHRYGAGQGPGEGYGHGPGAGARWGDPEVTEVLPRVTRPVPEASAVLPDEVTTTRPLPRIDQDRPPAARPRRVAPRAVVGGAVLLACAGAGLFLGGLVGREDTGREEAGRDGTTGAQAGPGPTGRSGAPETSYRITVETSDEDGAGTDSEVQGRLTDAQGRTSAWTVLDTPDHDDFEAGGTATYTIPVPADFGRPVRFQLWKAKGDDWAPSARTRITGPDAFEGLWGADGEADRYWLTDVPGPRAEDGPESPSYGPYSPEWAVTSASAPAASD